MAKNSKMGAVIPFAVSAVKYDGTVTEVNKAGVSIITRAYGKQAAVERFFTTADVIAASATGEGFVIVNENRPIEGGAYYGAISTDNGITVEVEGAGAITFKDTAGVQIAIHYDANDQPSSTEAKIAKRNSDKLATAVRRLQERAGSAKKPKADAKTKKKAK